MRPISSSVRSIFICGEYHKEDTKRLVLKGRKRSERFAPKEASQETSYRSPSALEPSVGELKNLSSLSIIETNIAALPDELGLLSKVSYRSRSGMKCMARSYAPYAYKVIGWL